MGSRGDVVKAGSVCMHIMGCLVVMMGSDEQMMGVNEEERKWMRCHCKPCDQSRDILLT